MTCSYANKVTIYNCRSGSLRDWTAHNHAIDAVQRVELG